MVTLTGRAGRTKINHFSIEKLKLNASRLPSESDNATKWGVYKAKTSKDSQKYALLSLDVFLLFSYIVVDTVC